MDSILIELIKIDGKTQHRELDTNVVDQYAEAMDEGAIFPPIELVHDGKDFYMWE
jgi:hypothetical protein